MERISLGPNTELLLAERGLGMPALVLGLAAGLNVFFWLRARYGISRWPHVIGLFAGTVLGGMAVVGGLIRAGGELHPVLGWGLAAAALAGAVVFAYRRGTRGATSRGSALLLALRFLALAVLVVLYLEPTLKLVKSGVERSRLLVLVDTSGSMKVNDMLAGSTRLGYVQSRLGGEDGVLARLAEDFDLELYAFATGLEPVSAEELPALSPGGRGTAFVPTVGKVCARADQDTVGALVLTDGIDNSGLGEEARIERIVQSRLPVFAVGTGTRLGEEEEFRNIAVANVVYKRRMAAENQAEVTVHVRADGLAGRRVPVIFRFDKKELARAHIELDAYPGTQAVELTFTPTEMGTHNCSVEIPPESDEDITDDNQFEFDVEVTEPGIKLLLVEGVMSPEHRWLLRTFQMDPNVELLSLVQIRKGEFTARGEIDGVDTKFFPRDYKTLSKFDVVMLRDIDVTVFDASQLANVEKFVESGGGLLMMGGYSALGPGGYTGTPLEETLPVALGGRDVGQIKDPFSPLLTPDGANHPIFSGVTEFFGTTVDAKPAKHLPPLQGCTRVGRARPGTTVLMVHPKKRGPDGARLIVAAVRLYGRGRSMVFTGDTTWRWDFELRGLGRNTPYVKFWGQAVRWLADHEVKEVEGKPGVTAYTDRKRYNPGSSVRIVAQVRGPQGQATNQADVVANINAPDGSASSVQLAYLPGTSGRYRVDYRPPGGVPGEYKMVVSATDAEDRPLGSQELAFKIEKPNQEFEQLDLDEPFLSEIAEQTGGLYRDALELDELVDRLQSKEREKRTVSTVNVWDDDSIRPFGKDGPGLSPYLLLAFLAFTALVTAEWVVRRRRQLV
ncbi:MAG: glutamine amidotransferase [Planctomycetota bacterium]